MAGLLGPELKDRIRDANDIVDLINSYVPLKRAGASFVALCPFHREKSPSFHVNPNKQIFHCFGCHKGGDVFTFVQEYEHLSFPEAVKQLAERAHIPLEWDESPEAKQRVQVKDLLYKIHEELTSRWHQLLLNDAQGEAGRRYLEQRGISAEAVSLFRLGFAPPEWSDTVNWAKSKSYDLALMEEAGLVARKEDSDHRYDRFRNRLMFPISDKLGRVIAFSGRVINDEEKGAKYVNSPETLLFKKGKELFGLDKARRPALEAKKMVVCEGQLDLIACHVNGLKNVVAPQGTALTADHARVLKNYVNEVILCFDSDNAGQQAIQRSFDDLLKTGTAVKVARLPSPHDPDSFIREFGVEAFGALLDKAPGYFDYLLEFLLAENDVKSDSGRATVVKTMKEAVSKTDDAVLVDTYAQKTSHLLGVAVEAMRQEFSKRDYRPVYPDEVIPPEEEYIVEIPRPSALEFWLLKIVVGEHDSELMDWLFHHLDLAWVQHPVVRACLIYRLDLLADNKPFEIRDLLTGVTMEGAASLITEAGSDERVIPRLSAQLSDIVLRLRNLHIDAELRQLAQFVPGPDDDEMERASHVLELQRTKRQPLQRLADA